MTDTEPKTNGPRLTHEQHVEIRRRSSKFQTNQAIAKAMGVNVKTVARSLKLQKGKPA